MKDTDSPTTTEETHPDMTPMIDVVFQLLIFFLVSMKFKTLDMKLEAFLPKNAGVTPTPPVPDENPTLVARLVRSEGSSVTHLKLQNRVVGTLDPRDAATTWATLSRAAAQIRANMAAEGGDPDAVRGEIDATPLVPTGEVIRAIDAFFEGDLRNVTFTGTPAPGSALDRLR